MQDFSQWMVKLEGKVKVLDIAWNKITSKGANILFSTLKECDSSINSLNLGANQLDDDCMAALGEFIDNNPYLEVLKVDYNKVTDKGMYILSPFLIGNTKLKQIALHENSYLTDACLPYVSDMARTSCLTEIMLFATAMSYESQSHVRTLLSIPIDDREVPIKSNTKSAAKVISQ